MTVENLLKSLRHVTQRPEALPRGPILVYGAGAKGKEVSLFLQQRGYDILGMADAAARKGASWSGLPIKKLSDWQDEHSIERAVIVIAIHNCHVDMAALIGELRRFNVSRVINPVEFQALFGEEFPDSYWLTSPSTYAGHEHQLIRLESLLADPFSRDLLGRIIEFRLCGRYDALPQPSPAEQYCPANLPRWRNPMRLIDGGAFDGDTLRKLRQNGYELEEIVAFEPDPKNYGKLSQEMNNLGRGLCIPCGLAATTGLASFDSNGTGASRISAQGQHVIQCVAIDEALPGMHPSLIKLDIEGGERGALEGAIRTISRSRPGLAICIYHDPTHLWEIPLLIESWQLEYRFFLGLHGYSSFDLVLYGLPNR